MRTCVCADMVATPLRSRFSKTSDGGIGVREKFCWGGGGGAEHNLPE